MPSQFQSIKKWKYDVFLNFRREDFDGSFVTDLYKRLEDKEIKAFKHDVKSERGAPFSTELSEAIEGSRIAITIFSEEYALSGRCLEEITKIMECVDSHGQVFYRTEPSVVSRTFDLNKNKEYFNGADLKRFQDALSKAFEGFNEDHYYPFQLICWNNEECIEEIVDQASKGIEMHVWKAQLGQQVTRDAEQGKPWNRSRLWHEKDMNTVFSANQIARTHTFSVAPQNEDQKWKYDAFLSFRGDDTRNNFVAHLYKRLQDIGINVFKDDVKLERGKFISTELLKAIEESRTAIIIFSEDYASSSWCLEELTMIMECVDKKEQKAYPVFYNVEPSDIRMKTESSSFAKALEKHREDFKANFEKLATKHEADLALRKKDETNQKDNLVKVQRWKDTLHRAAGIAGLDVRKTANGAQRQSHLFELKEEMNTEQSVIYVLYQDGRSKKLMSAQVVLYLDRFESRESTSLLVIGLTNLDSCWLELLKG